MVHTQVGHVSISAGLLVHAVDGHDRTSLRETRPAVRYSQERQMRRRRIPEARMV
jgi:hypothetical protein